jgi:prophage antirepressor-like protein
MNQLFKFQETNISVMGTPNEPMFFASQVAKALGYIDTTDAVRKHIWNDNKITVQEYRLKNIPGESPGIPGIMGPLANINHRTVLVNEPGIYQLIFASKLETAKKFQKWVIGDVLPSIRKTGSYKIPKLIHNQFIILNELNLHEKVVDYIRKYFADVIFNASLGELQDTSEKRINSYKMGYTSGMPDLMIYEHNQHNNGLCIEIKTPKGTGILSEKQKEVNNQLSDRGFKTYISDNYDDIIIIINEYLSNRRFKCNKCKYKFHTPQTLKTHQRVIHRIN